MKITVSLMVIITIVFILQSLAPPSTIHGYQVDWVTANFALIPADAFSGSVWQFFTYMFLHGSITHLFVNMFVLLMFGSQLERALGRKKFLFLYIVAGIGSGFFYILLSYFFTPLTFALRDLIIPMIGASGAIYGIMAGYGLLYPKNWIIMFPGIPMPAGIAVFVFAAIEFFFGLTGFESGVANFGHLGGLIFGLVLVYWWKKRSEKELFDPKTKGWDFVWE